LEAKDLDGFSEDRPKNVRKVQAAGEIPQNHTFLRRLVEVLLVLNGDVVRCVGVNIALITWR
jgi:hypothetical protein